MVNVINSINLNHHQHYHQASTPLLLLQSCPSPRRIRSGVSRKVILRCSAENRVSSKSMVGHVLSGMAASLILLSQTNQVPPMWQEVAKLKVANRCADWLARMASSLPIGIHVLNSPPNGLDIWVVTAEVLPSHNICQIASAADSKITLPLEESSDGRGGKLMMMRGMTAKDFDPVRYSGRWFEVASLKRGFAGQGQEDCHCTQGVYTFDMDAPAIQVDTFCVHGGPDGYITGIRGRVQCLPEEELKKNETELEKQEMIKEKCYLRFPTLPFIPKEPYDVIATDYDNFSLVSGAKDRSFIQIYSRTPEPGPEFIEKYKNYLGDFGYDPNKIKATPQDCEVMSNSKLAAMMSMSGMQQALTNQFPDLELKAPIEINPFVSVFDTLKKLLELYFK